MKSEADGQCLGAFKRKELKVVPARSLELAGFADPMDILLLSFTVIPPSEGRSHFDELEAARKIHSCLVLCAAVC